MRKVLMAATLAAVLQSASGAVAQTYPSRPITIIVPFPAGGPTDTLARILADHMSASLAQSVIIENVSRAHRLSDCHPPPSRLSPTAPSPGGHPPGLRNQF